MPYFQILCSFSVNCDLQALYMLFKNNVYRNILLFQYKIMELFFSRIRADSAAVSGNIIYLWHSNLQVIETEVALKINGINFLII